MGKTVFLAMAAMAFAVLGNSFGAQADDGLPTAYDDASNMTINYDDWDLILSSSVLDTGLSDRRPASRNGARVTGTRIKHGNLNPTAFEGNRVMFYQFKQAHVDALLAIRQDLEAVTTFAPLEQFSKNEQLAYWLNLHNVAVMYEIAKAYPVKKIRDLAEGDSSAWDDKTMAIGGISTSIRDIQNHVVANWNDPLVLYGFFTGTVGGPSVQDLAFTGENVRGVLRKSAREFVNSLRGFRAWNGYGRVSQHYDIGARYFPNFDEDIKEHMLTYATDSVRRGLEEVNSFKTNNYDWHIADLKAGDVYNGSSINTSSGALALFIQGDNRFSLTGFSDGSFDKTRGTMPPQIRALIRAVKERKARQYRQGEVTVEEFIDADGGRVSSKKSGEGSSNDPADSENRLII